MTPYSKRIYTFYHANAILLSKRDSNITITTNTRQNLCPKKSYLTKCNAVSSKKNLWTNAKKKMGMEYGRKCFTSRTNVFPIALECTLTVSLWFAPSNLSKRGLLCRST